MGLALCAIDPQGEDGYDTVSWLVEQPWCNGRVGTFGCSYPCEVQYLQAPLMHPALKCMIPQNGPALGAANGRYRYWSGYKGGVLDWGASYTWYVDAGSTYPPPPGWYAAAYSMLQL